MEAYRQCHLLCEIQFLSSIQLFDNLHQSTAVTRREPLPVVD